MSQSAADGSTETVRTQRAGSAEIGPREVLSHRADSKPKTNPQAFGLGDFGFSTESLILAQDERWRRA